jgi:hypothetical protein
VIPAPAINISGTTTVNQGQSITISATVTNAGTGPAYQWQDSTQTHSWTNIPGATAPTLVYTPAATGDKLRCLLTSTAVCAPPSAITSNVLEFTVTILTALDPVPGNSYGIRYYPNPASQILTIDSLKLRDQWLSADIFGMDGKKTTVSAILSGQQKMQLNLGRLSAGVYTVVLRRKQGAAVYFKLLRL